MAETSGFFRSVNRDRQYKTDWLAKWVSSFISNGVYNGELSVTGGGNMSVVFPAGKAWINGYYYQNDAPITLPISNADGVLHRKDTIVLRWDVNERSITAQVLQGTFASNPIAPEIVRSVEQYDLKLAEISIPAGTTAITQALITDTRLENSVCGIVTGVIDQVDTTTLYNQIQADLQHFHSVSETEFAEWKAEFDDWFAGVKDILGEDEAGNLLNLINDHKADGSAHITTYIHTKSGNIHNFSGTGSNGKARITADFVEGDTFTVNGQPVTAKLQNGVQPTGEFFAAGCWVQFIYDADANQLNFSAGGSKQIPTTYAGKLTVSVAAYDGGSIASTKVRIQNSSLGMDLAYTPDALGKVTVELTGNKTYSITLIDVPEPYYGEAATQYIGFDTDNSLSLQLKDQPDIIGFKMNLTTGEITYTDGAVGWSPMVMDWDTDTLDPGYFINSWLVKDIRPCLLKDGVVQYYLKRTGFLMYDYSLQENGQPSNLTGVDGNVMIEHPRLWFNTFDQVESGVHYAYIQISKQQINSNWSDGPFIGRETFYYPAYVPMMLSNIPVSVAGLAAYNGKSYSVNSELNESSNTFSLQKINARLGPNWSSANGTFPYFLTMFNMLFKTTDLSVLGTISSTDATKLTGRMNDRPLIWGANTSLERNFKFLGTEELFYRALVQYRPSDTEYYFLRVRGIYANPYNYTTTGLRMPTKTSPGGFDQNQLSLLANDYVGCDTMEAGPINVGASSLVRAQSTGALGIRKSFPFAMYVDAATVTTQDKFLFTSIRSFNSTGDFKTTPCILYTSTALYNLYDTSHNYQNTTYGSSNIFIPRFSFHPPLEP